MLNMCSYIYIHITKAHSTCVYALLPGKIQDLYSKLLDEMLNLIYDDIIPNPASIMTGSEKVVINVSATHFPQADFSG